MDKFFLIYINKVGKNYKDDYLYEFIFSDSVKDIDGEEWDVYPASGRPSAPHEQFIKRVGRLESKLVLDVVQDSDTFAVWDAVDGVIALSWENIDVSDVYPEKRLCFRFGETKQSVEEKLYEKDLTLSYNKQNHE